MADDVASPAGPAAPKEVRRALALLGIVVVCLVVVYVSPLRHLLIEEGGQAQLRGWFDSLGALGPEIFVIGGALLIAVAVPRLLFSFLGGALYGVTFGFLLSLLATVLGSMLTFWFGRKLGHAYVARRFAQRSRHLQRFFALLERHGIVGNVLIRIAPVGNCFATNLLLSLSPVKFRDFVIGSTLGLAPHALVAAIFGSSAQGHVAMRWISAALLFLVITILYVRLRRRSRMAQELESDLKDDDA